VFDKITKDFLPNSVSFKLQQEKQDNGKKLYRLALKIPLQNFVLLCLHYQEAEIKMIFSFYPCTYSKY